MTKQKRHLRHSKRGKIFKAGRRINLRGEPVAGFPSKKKVKQWIEDVVYFEQGYKWVNGGYVIAIIEHMKKMRNIVRVIGHTESGIQDMGDGHAEQNTDELDIYLIFEDGKLKYIDDNDKRIPESLKDWGFDVM